jgi:hypothetical protein
MPARRAAVLHRIWWDGPLPLSDLRELVPDDASGSELAEHLLFLGHAGLIDIAEDPADPLFGPAAAPGAEERARRGYAALLNLPTCRVCGCSDSWACEDGCWWLAEGVCSNCGGGDSLMDDAVGA